LSMRDEHATVDSFGNERRVEPVRRTRSAPARLVVGKMHNPHDAFLPQVA
jgi:hypothetical protein